MGIREEFFESMEQSGYTLISIDAATALRAGRLTAVHGDPFAVRRIW